MGWISKKRGVWLVFKCYLHLCIWIYGCGMLLYCKSDIKISEIICCYLNANREIRCNRFDIFPYNSCDFDSPALFSSKITWCVYSWNWCIVFSDGYKLFISHTSCLSCLYQNCSKHYESEKYGFMAVIFSTRKNICRCFALMILHFNAMYRIFSLWSFNGVWRIVIDGDWWLRNQKVVRMSKLFFLDSRSFFQNSIGDNSLAFSS